MLQLVLSRYKELCEKIIHLDGKIRFVGLVNDNGKLVTGSAKDKIHFYVDDKDREMLFMEVALRTRMLGEFDPYLGSMNFSIYHRKALIILEFPLENKTLFVSSEKGLDFNEIPFKIIDLIRNENVFSITG